MNSTDRIAGSYAFGESVRLSMIPKSCQAVFVELGIHHPLGCGSSRLKKNSNIRALYSGLIFYFNVNYRGFP